MGENKQTLTHKCKLVQLLLKAVWMLHKGVKRHLPAFV